MLLRSQTEQVSLVEEGEGPSGTAQEKVSEMVNDLGCILKQTNKQTNKKQNKTKQNNKKTKHTIWVNLGQSYRLPMSVLIITILYPR